jgi:hypothetical protein
MRSRTVHRAIVLPENAQVLHPDAAALVARAQRPPVRIIATSSAREVAA